MTRRPITEEDRRRLRRGIAVALVLTVAAWACIVILATLAGIGYQLLTHGQAAALAPLGAALTDRQRTRLLRDWRIADTVAAVLLAGVLAWLACGG